MKTLNVIKTNLSELTEHWGFRPSIGGELFIRCNAKGEVNWDKAPVYKWSEIQQEQKRRRVCFRVPESIFQL